MVLVSRVGDYVVAVHGAILWFCRAPARTSCPCVSRAALVHWTNAARLTPSYVHVAEEDGLGLQIELVALGLDLHGFANVCSEGGIVIRMITQHLAKVKRMFLAQA